MHWKRSMAVIGFAAALAACSGSKSGSGSGNLKVSAKGAGTAPADTPGATSLDAGNGILIDQVRVVVRKIEVEGPAAACTPATPPPAGSGMALAAGSGASVDDHGGGGGDGGGGSDDGANEDSNSDDDSCEIEQGPFLVVLSGSDLASGTHPVFDVSVPAGTYHEVSLRIDTLSAGKAAQAPVEAQRAPLADFAARGVSLEVTGTMDAAPFTFTAALEVRQKREGEITIDADHAVDLTFTLPASGWFTAADGSKLDPTDPAAAPAILANVRASLRLVHDENHDGADDDHGDDGPGHT